jgi:hypothetical protein
VPGSRPKAVIYGKSSVAALFIVRPEKPRYYRPKAFDRANYKYQHICVYAFNEHRAPEGFLNRGAQPGTARLLASWTAELGIRRKQSTSNPFQLLLAFICLGTFPTI